MTNLAKACELSLNDWLATFPDIIPEAERSKKHEKWKKNLFNKMRDDHYHRFTTKTIKVLLVAAVIFALLMTAFVIPSSRKYMLDNLNHFSRYKVTENNKNSVDGEITVGYIPEGFELDESIDLGKQIIHRYHNINGEFFTVFKNSSAAEVDFDTENFVLEEITFNGVNYIYCKGNFGMNSIVWNKNDYVYKIEAPLKKEELIKIAEMAE